MTTQTSTDWVSTYDPTVKLTVREASGLLYELDRLLCVVGSPDGYRSVLYMGEETLLLFDRAVRTLGVGGGMDRTPGLDGKAHFRDAVIHTTPSDDDILDGVLVRAEDTATGKTARLLRFFGEKGAN